MRWRSFLLACCALDLLFGSVHAADDRVSLTFDGIKLPELARLAYGELSRRPFVLSPEFDANDKSISLRLPAVSKRQAMAAIEQAIRREGFDIATRAGIVWIEPEGKPIEAVEVYAPRYRAASYILDAVSPFFKAGSFGNQRGVSMAGQQVPAMGGASHQGSAPGQGVPNRPPADTGSSAFSIQDRQPDMIVFRGTAEEAVKFRALVEQIDTRPAEVLVKAVVFEVATDQSEGSALSIAGKLLGVNLKIGAAGVAGDWSAVFHGAGLEVVYNDLAKDSRFKVVSSPRLRVMSGKSARLVVGADTPVLGAASLDKNGNLVQSVEYKSSGVIFNLTPQLRDDLSELQITQQISNFVQTTTGVNNSPTLIKRELSTALGVSDGDVVILGGLDEGKDTAGSAGPSWFPSWLRSTSSQKTKSEILLILQVQRI